MAWSFQTIKYGWRIGIAAVLAGGITIYTAINVQRRITQRDAIEVILGVVERALATQTGTNADGSAIYAVAPPSFARNWYSNDYVATVTNGVTNWTAVLYTNVFTNVISERLDRAMLVSLDDTIKALVPYYCDTSSVYDGTTNIIMLTFTGLLTSLNLGDHTNFTSIPSWTNNPGTTNATTNAATFGPWAWRNYVVAWQERYKVLNALKANYFTDKITVTNQEIKTPPSNDVSYAAVSTTFLAASWGAPGVYGYDQTHGMFAAEGWGILDHYMLRLRGQFAIAGGYSTNVSISKIEAYAFLNYVGMWNGSDAIVPGASNTYHRITTMTAPTSGDFPHIDATVYGDSDAVVPGPGSVDQYYDHNWNIARNDFPSPPSGVGQRSVVVFWNFSYCTNKYW